MRVRRARTSCVTSLTILDLAFGGMVVNHFAKRTFPRYGFRTGHHICIGHGLPTLSGDEEDVVDHVCLLISICYKMPIARTPGKRPRKIEGKVAVKR